MMTRFLIAGAVVLRVLVVDTASAVDIDIHATIPPPPRIVFEQEPEVIVVPSTQVQYVPVVTDYDMYRYGKYWYVNQDGYWYRSRSYRGPFKFVEQRHIPHDVIVVPADYGHHPRHPPKPAKHRKNKKQHGDR